MTARFFESFLKQWYNIPCKLHYFTQQPFLTNDVVLSAAPKKRMSSQCPSGHCAFEESKRHTLKGASDSIQITSPSASQHVVRNMTHHKIVQQVQKTAFGWELFHRLPIHALVTLVVARRATGQIT